MLQFPAHLLITKVQPPQFNARNKGGGKRGRLSKNPWDREWVMSRQEQQRVEEVRTLIEAREYRKALELGVDSGD